MTDGTDVRVDDARRRDVDGSRLVSEIGIDAREIDWRKSFTGFDDRDAARMADMDDTLEEIRGDLVEAFYDHLQRFDETVEIFGRSSKSVAQLKESQRRYLTDLGRGEYDERYFERRARIGKIHDMLDLGPKVYLGAYSIYYEGILEAIADDLAASATSNGGVAAGDAPGSGSPAVPESTRAALDEMVERSLSALKLLNLDQQVAMETYIHSFNRKLERELARQRDVAAEVDAAVTEVDGTCTEVASASEEISDMAATQTEAMEQVAAEVSTMSATIEEIASTADQVAANSDHAAERTAAGRESARDALASMDDVSDSADAVVDDVAALQERVDEVDGIIDVINDIAEQTNVLALNASIEAARAGDAGDGFAVVATEVKELAEETRAHATDVESILDEIQTDTAETVESLEHMVETVSSATEQVEAAAEDFVDVAEAVRETATGISEVADATDDQAASAEEVASQVERAVDDVSSIATQIREVADANQTIAEEVSTLQSSVARLDREAHDGTDSRRDE